MRMAIRGNCSIVVCPPEQPKRVLRGEELVREYEALKTLVRRSRRPAPSSVYSQRPVRSLSRPRERATRRQRSCSRGDPSEPDPVAPELAGGPR
jgi:hypothetical protein